MTKIWIEVADQFTFDFEIILMDLFPMQGMYLLHFAVMQYDKCAHTGT